MLKATSQVTGVKPHMRNSSHINGEFQSIHVVYCLYRENYLNWLQLNNSQGKRKLSHILDTEPQSDHPQFAVLDYMKC